MLENMLVLFFEISIVKFYGIFKSLKIIVIKLIFFHYSLIIKVGIFIKIWSLNKE